MFIHIFKTQKLVQKADPTLHINIQSQHENA